MDQFRSQSQADGRNMQLEVYSRSYSTPYSYDYEFARDSKKDKSKAKKGWLNDPEFQRKKRVARYKSFTVERKVKGSVTNSFQWLKDRYYKVVYGWW